MAELTKEDVKEAVREAMAEKFEMTLGIDCRSAEERVETRQDMEFLRTLRKGAHKAGERLFLLIVGLVGAAVIAWAFPGVSKYLK
jgi:hypothetical protein